MKIKLLFTFMILMCFSQNIFSQQTLGRCGANEMFQEAIKSNSQYERNQRDLEIFTAQYLNQEKSKQNAHSNGNKQAVVRIIPVVVHVIHTGGQENISKAQILSQIDRLNADFRRTNSDTTNTPGPFKSLSGDSEIEFRMAQLDPNGNCTDGIVRVYSSLTNNANDLTKALSYWPSNMYMNVWLVASTQIMRVGYAQFPGTGPASTDGIVVMASYYGTIGTASGTKGRTAVHEAGHWLNLRHIWGDDAGACSGSDFVADTPNQSGDNSFLCPNFPLLDACTPSGNGVMFGNYMDYSTEACQNMFSVGQTNRMNAALSSPTSGRNNLWTATNLALTGVSQPVALCAADFSNNTKNNTICENGLVTFSDISYNGPVSSRTWIFNGGSVVPPSTLNDSVVTVQYLSAGNHDVSLTVSDGTSSFTKLKTAHMNVFANQATYTGNFYFEGFESLPLPNVDWQVESPDSGNLVWTQNNTAAFSGSSSAFVENFIANTSDVDELIGPTINTQNIFSQTSPGSLSLSFQCAFAKKASANNDALKVMTSTDCGRTWTTRLTLNATTLSSITGVKTSYFTPLASEWKKHTVGINNLIAVQNARIKFQFTSGGGNNLYLDDINISNLITGLDEQLIDVASISIFPNPIRKESLLCFTPQSAGSATIQIVDILGKEVSLLFSGTIEKQKYQLRIDEQNNLAPGIYFVKATINNQLIVKKISVE